MNLFQKFRTPSPPTAVEVADKSAVCVAKEKQFLELFELCQEQGLIPATAKPAVYSMFFMLGQGRLH